MKDLDNNTNNPTFKIVRDFIIKGLGLASLGWLSDTFLKEGFGLGALRNKVSSGVSVKGSVSGLKVLDRKPSVVDDEGIEHRRIRYRVDLWVSQLKDELAYKSGGEHRPYRTHKQRQGLYRYFTWSLFPLALYRQIQDDPSLVQEAESAEAPSTFLRNILRLQEWIKSRK